MCPTSQAGGKLAAGATDLECGGEERRLTKFGPDWTEWSAPLLNDRLSGVQFGPFPFKSLRRFESSTTSLAEFVPSALGNPGLTKDRK
jgi:hypothetical protein